MLRNGEEWWDLSSNGQARSFTGRVPDPFKKTPQSPLRSIPGGNGVETIKTDVMHVFNLGFGGDLASSTILALVRMKQIFAGRSIQNRLDHAYERYYSWCVEHKKTSSIPAFEQKKFKVTKFLVLCSVSF